MMQEIDYTIKVFCDGHASGKVAKIETFYREADADRSGQRWWFTRTEHAVLGEDFIEETSGRGRTGESTYRKEAQSQPDWPNSLESVHRRYDAPDLGRRNRLKYECNLCGLALPANEGTLNRALDLVAAQPQWRIADGVSRISLELLQRVASSLPS
jgi:hypothetical protein